jgi:hypothetical protein
MKSLPKTAPFGSLLLLALVASAQTASPPPAAPPTPNQQTWSNADLHLSFSYPSELKPMDPASLPGAAHNSVFGDDPNSESESFLSGRCAQALLSVGKVDDPQHPGHWASILLTEIDPSCIPPKALINRKAMDNILTPAVSAGTRILGMVPSGPAVAYLVQGHKVHFAQSEGQPVSQSALQPANGSQKLAVLAVQVNDRVLSWKIESNDPGLFTRMLGSHVDFGLGAPEMLFPIQPPVNSLDTLK